MKNKEKKIGIVSDHAGYQMKEFLTGYLDSLGYEVFDFGCHSDESCNYAEYAHPMGYAIGRGELLRGIALCGSGNGISMTLNKHRNIRAALCWTPEIAELARKHNDANACSIPVRFVENTTAMQIVEKFLETPFEGGRHSERIAKIPLPECNT